MKTITNILCALLVILTAAVSISRAATLTFDDVPKWTQVGDHYASLGVHFSLTDFGVQEGLANGDNGNWGLNGTVGPYFDGFNGVPGYTMMLYFDSPVTGFTMDVSRSNGSSAGDSLTVAGWSGLAVVDSRTITFGPINSWTTISLSGVFDRIAWVGDGVDFHPFGVDNIKFTVVPEPATFTLLVVATVVFLGLRRRA